MSEKELNKTNSNEKNPNEDIIEELNDEELENVTGGLNRLVIGSKVRGK